ncbi:MAG: hypothetical protein IJ111_08455 [Eggerthellaceae bacterium]|nr:hypothetical protein [Eggerthellaceae bacterium]
MDAIAQAQGEERELYRDVLSATALGGQVSPRFASKLEAAHSADEFIELVYDDPDMRQERAWAYIAKRCDEGDWAQRLGYDGADNFGELRNGPSLIEPADPDTSPVIYPVPDSRRAYLFHDGAFNREIAWLVGSLDGHYRCGSLDLRGRFDVYERNGSLFFERWSTTSSASARARSSTASRARPAGASTRRGRFYLPDFWWSFF